MSKNILYLYSEVMGYTISTIKVLIEAGYAVHVIHYDHDRKRNYVIPSIAGMHLYSRLKLTTQEIAQLAEKINPCLTVVSGWTDKSYLATARNLRKADRLVVTGLDNQWQGSIRQWLGVLACQFGYLNSYFSHVWVSGTYQYEFARSLGFGRRQIKFDMYSADLSLFHSAYNESQSEKTIRYPHRFLYVGRFADIKGLDILLTAWKEIGDKRKDWDLHLIGNGPLHENLMGEPGIVVKNFMQPEQLLQEVARSGCFLLPSKMEPWGVVVHEFGGAGMPMILSDVVGSASSFLIPGYNGYQFEVNSVNDLKEAMIRMIAHSDEELNEMSKRSHQLSYRITPETSAFNLLSCLVDEC